MTQQETIDHFLKQYPSWARDGKKLFREFLFADFKSVLPWMVAVGIEAERLDHHPEWLNVYNRVKVWCITHDLDRISEKDLQLAQICEDLYCKFEPKEGN